MTVSYNKIESMCKQRKTNITEVCKVAAVPRSALSDYKAGRKKTVSPEYLEKIANQLEVDVNSFYEGEQRYCLLCGSDSFDMDESGRLIHQERHKLWEKAVEKFGFCWPIRVRESIKAEARSKIESGNLTDEEIADEHERVFKALFSRSLEASGYNLDHATFHEYVAMLLHQPSWAMSIENKPYQILARRFGTKPGISTGTYFYVPKFEQKEKPTPVSESGLAYPVNYDKLSSTNKAIVDRLIADLAKSQSEN